MGNIIQLRAQVKIGIQTFPAGYRFNLDELPENIVSEIEKAYKKNNRIFSGDVPFKKSGSKTEKKETKKDELAELREKGKSLKIKGWQVMSKEGLETRIASEIERKKEQPKKEISEKKTGTVKIKATKSFIKKHGLKGVKEGEEVEVSNE